MLGSRQDRSVRDVNVSRYIQGQERGAVLDESRHANVGQALAVGQCETFEALADGERRDRAVVQDVGEVGEVESLYEVSV